MGNDRQYTLHQLLSVLGRLNGCVECGLNAQGFIIELKRLLGSLLRTNVPHDTGIARTANFFHAHHDYLDREAAAIPVLDQCFPVGFPDLQHGTQIMATAIRSE